MAVCSLQPIIFYIFPLYCDCLYVAKFPLGCLLPWLGTRDILSCLRWQLTDLKKRRDRLQQVAT